MKEKIKQIINELEGELTINQTKLLQQVLIKYLLNEKHCDDELTNDEYLQMFINAKQVEGCSKRTIKYYKETVSHLHKNIQISVRKLTTDDIRHYLSHYQTINNCSKTTIDNVRRNISSFFSWLEAEDYILKSPMKRIHKIRTQKLVKEVISDESIVKLRDNCKCIRDLAMIDLLILQVLELASL